MDSELRELNKRHSSEQVEWKQFREDLHTAVVIANNFKTEAEQDIESIRAQNQSLQVLRVCILKGGQRGANNKSSEVCGIIKPDRRVKLNRSQAVNVHKLLTIRNLREGEGGERRISVFSS